MRCVNCGNEIPDSAKVCGYCGMRLRGSSPSPVSSDVLLLAGGAALVFTGILFLIGLIWYLLRDFPKKAEPVAPSAPTAVIEESQPPQPVEAPCQDKVSFVAHMGAPENAVFSPGESFVKTWRLKNAGSCNWTSDYALSFFSGDRMDGVDIQRLGRGVAPGQEADVSVQFNAPSAPGKYAGMWRLINADGLPVPMEGANIQGYFFVRIEVKAQQTAPQPQASERCALFDGMKMSIMWLEIPKGSADATFYIKMPGGVPGLEKAVAGDLGSWVYTVKIGTYQATNCRFLKGYKERLYCDFRIPSEYSNTFQTFELRVNNCSQAIYSVKSAEIPALPAAKSGGKPGGGSNGGTTSPACSSSMDAAACAAAGGIYVQPFCDPNPCAPFCSCP